MLPDVSAFDSARREASFFGSQGLIVAMVKMMGWKLLPKELQVAIANAPFSKFARSLGKLSRSLARQRCAEQVRRLLHRLADNADHSAFEMLIFGATCEISVERDSAFAELTW